MSWQIQWGYAALAALRSMPWRQAAYVDAAVQRLAAKNQGHLVRVPQVHPYGARLYAGPFVAFLTLDPEVELGATGRASAPSAPNPTPAS